MRAAILFATSAHAAWLSRDDRLAIALLAIDFARAHGLLHFAGESFHFYSILTAFVWVIRARGRHAAGHAAISACVPRAFADEIARESAERGRS